MHKLLTAFKKNKLKYGFNIIVSFIYIVPFMWALSTSLKTPQKIAELPPNWIPENITFQNYQMIWTINDNIFIKYFFNSVFVTVFTVVSIVILASLSGYGFSKLKIPFKNFIFILILASLMIPFHALLVPLYSIMKDFSILNTRLSLIIIYVTFRMPFGIFMMRNSFDSIPDSIRESALIDGASEFKTFSKILLPLTFPGLATTAIYAAYMTWNDFIIALIFTTSNDMRTLTVGLSNLAVGQYGTSWGLLTSGAIVSFIPMILLYVFLQKYFIAGLTSGAVKS